MSYQTAWILAFILIGVVVAFMVRETILYRRDRQTREDIYPYTKTRLGCRVLISGILILETLFLLPIRYTLKPDRPLWFVVYTALVILGVVVMVLLALIDFRESGRLLAQSKARLFKEFVQELQQDETGSPPQ